MVALLLLFGLAFAVGGLVGASSSDVHGESTVKVWLPAALLVAAGVALSLGFRW